MKNITLAIDEKLLKEVRKYAAEHDTSVNAIVRAKLAEVVAPKKRMADAGCCWAGCQASCRAR